MFRIYSQHSIPDQPHGVTGFISSELETNNKYLCGISLNIAPVFDTVWHYELLLKLKIYSSSIPFSLTLKYLKSELIQNYQSITRVPRGRDIVLLFLTYSMPQTL